MTQSASIGALAAALAKAQGSLKIALKDTANPFYKSKFADLASVWEACRTALSSNGLSVTQIPDGTETMVMHTTLMHASGEWISGSYPIRPVKSDPQGIGSAISYARRYSLAAMVGVVADDDDGEAASGRPAPVAKTTSKGEVYTKQPKWTPEQVNEAGTIRADIIGYGGDPADKEVATLKGNMKGDAPQDVIDALVALRAKWNDIANQSTQEG